MTRDSDDDALTWDGDADPTLDAAPGSPKPPAARSLPEGFTAVGKGAADVAPSEPAENDAAAPDAAAAEPRPTGSATLVTVGVLAGIHALWTLGWVLGGLRLQGTAEFLVSSAAYVPSLWLAALAPAIWFAAVTLLTRGGRTWVRLTWLVAGAVLLVPWPFVMTGTVGR